MAFLDYTGLGHFLDKLKTIFVQVSSKGAANGVAELDSTGKVPLAQLPAMDDDVIEGYYYNNKFYEESSHTTEITGVASKIYISKDTNKIYRFENNSYVEITSSDVMTGATSQAAGKKGLVPAPLAGEQDKFLKADGTWDDVLASGVKVITITGTITNASGAYSGTFQDGRVVDDMKAVTMEISNPEIFGDDISVTCNNGSITIACSDVAGTSTFAVSVITSSIMSTEYEALDEHKADKVANATANSFAGLDAYGNLTDSCLSVVNGELCITILEEVED